MAGGWPSLKKKSSAKFEKSKGKKEVDMKRKALSLVLFITLCFVGSTSMAEDKFEPNNLRNFIETEMKNWNVPAAAVLIVKNDQVIFSEGFGYRDLEKKLKVTSDTIFPIGSAGKSFTALALGMLVDEKKLDFDQPVRSYLPMFRMYDDYLTGHLSLIHISEPTRPY